MSWGWQKESVELTLTQISKATGLDHLSNTNRAINRLEKIKYVKVLTSEYKPAKRYRINFKNDLLKYKENLNILTSEYKKHLTNENNLKNGILNDQGKRYSHLSTKVLTSEYPTTQNRVQKVLTSEYLNSHKPTDDGGSQDPKEKKEIYKKKKERKKPGKEFKNDSLPSFSDNRARKAKKLTEEECEDRIAKLRKQAEQIENDEKFKN
jgi:hypothetical protein